MAIALAVPAAAAALDALLKAIAFVGSAIVAAAAAQAVMDAYQESEAATQDKLGDFIKIAPIAKQLNEAMAKAKADACTDKKPCPALPPQGVPISIRRNLKPGSDSELYQVQVSGFPLGWEWKFREICWDGFRPLECTLVEAKGHYEQFFTDKGKPQYWTSATARMEEEAQKHCMATAADRPPVNIVWYFMETLPYTWAQEAIGSDPRTSDIQLVHQPLLKASTPSVLGG